MQQLIDHGFENSLLLEMSLPNIYPDGKREDLHKEAKQRGLKMGIWGWYMTEYETDQMPMIHVNAKALKEFYQQIRAGTNKIGKNTGYYSASTAASQVFIVTGFDDPDIFAELELY